MSQELARLAKGDSVRLEFSYAGLVSYEEWTVLRRRGSLVWLDNGPGNPPSGPFDVTTGYHKEFREQRLVPR